MAPARSYEEAIDNAPESRNLFPVAFYVAEEDWEDYEPEPYIRDVEMAEEREWAGMTGPWD